MFHFKSNQVTRFFSFKFLPVNFILLSFSFILFTAAGTLLHEAGHYAVARWVGYEAKINYKSSYFNLDSNDLKYLEETFRIYRDSIQNNRPFPGDQKFYFVSRSVSSNSIRITWGGPIQSMLTGTLGLLLLWIYRRKHGYSDKVSVSLWMLIFLSLFWLRQLANLAVGLFLFIRTGVRAVSGDEARLTDYYNLPPWTIELATGIPAVCVLFYILFYQIPLKFRLTFLLAGLVGGVSGYYLWLYKLGPVILP